MHRLLKRQIERLGLDAQTPPDAARWADLLARIGASYTQADETRQLTERSMEICSTELREAYARERSANEALEERVRLRTAELQRAELAARASELRFRNLTALSSDWYWEQDANFQFVDIARGDRSENPVDAFRIGKRRWDLPTLNMTEEDWEAHRALVQAHLPFYDLELCQRLIDGSVRWITTCGEPIFDAEGRFCGYRGVGKDITARKSAEERVRNQALQQRLIAEFGQQALARPELENVMASAVDLVASTLRADFVSVLELGPDGDRLVYRTARPALRGAAGESIPLEPGSRLDHMLSSGETLVVADYHEESCSWPCALFANGARSAAKVPVFGSKDAFGILCAQSCAKRLFTQDEVDFLRSIANILAIAIGRKTAEDRLAHLAQFDTVTGLPNRHLFRDRLGQSLAQARRDAQLGAVMFIDLDRFKAVNDTFGHGVGDKLLGMVAARLSNCVRASDTVARLGGDEFALWLANLATADDAVIVARKIVDAVAEPFALDGHQTYVSASIGIALFPGDGYDFETLLKNADTAMYRAKEQGRNGYQFYLPQMNERLVKRLGLESKLRGALDRGEFLLHYQPKASLRDGAVCGLEALLRWCPDGTIVPPGEFVPILEDTGLIVQVGEWVIAQVCAQIGEWEAAGIAVKPVAVNISARQFLDRNLVAMIARALRDSGVDPGLLELELTETLIMSDAEEAVEMLRQLKATGVRLSVDDFGTGYSSLAYLKRFPLDVLKIDRSFIRDAVTDPDDAVLTQTIINLGHSMRLSVVAEGVETAEQLQFLRLHGCDEMQGFYFSKPLPVGDCTRFLMAQTRLEGPHGRSLALKFA